MQKKNPFLKKRKSSEEMTIQITSMADIFTIILVFLLKSYSTSATNITPSNGLKLPTANSAEVQVESIRLEISENAVQVENQPINELHHFRFESKDIQTNGSSAALNKSLQAQKKKQLLIANMNSDVKADQKILIVADQRTPYSTLKSVLASAAISGYTDFKLVVARPE
jgi:biopolymer transport protein ExbD